MTLAGSLEHYFVPLLFLDASLFAPYILCLEGNLNAVLQTLRSDEKASFLFLQQVRMIWAFHLVVPSSAPDSRALSSLHPADRQHARDAEFGRNAPASLQPNRAAPEQGGVFAVPVEQRHVGVGGKSDQ